MFELSAAFPPLLTADKMAPMGARQWCALRWWGSRGSLRGPLLFSNKPDRHGRETSRGRDTTVTFDELFCGSSTPPY